MKKHFVFIHILVMSFVVLTGCNSFEKGEIQKVGMLVENSVSDQTWGNKGYKGLVEIKEEYNVDVYFKEEMKTQQDVNRAVEEFSAKGINLIFGHSSIYGKMFDNISDSYPDIHFVYFNGGYYNNDNLTSLNFNSHAMGFFAGMIAGEMTKTNKVGLIAAFEWQPEVEGFYEGVYYQNREASVSMDFVNSWDNEERAIQLFDRMNAQEVDVFYPAGDAFSFAVLEEVNKNDKYGIGFVTDQSHLGDHVLTSTIQQVNELYLLAADKFNNEKLKGGYYTFDFQEGVITLGEFSPEVPNSFESKVNKDLESYIETGLLPNELGDLPNDL
ncbi:BMP family ABC transporter substrate-binding protein [Aquibacillus koreensis]|uniref:BMP family ABC transporter substrate-binding protein n=1 Tax=Aquibacillus koreensis TaxID=279446 RepID=A0A9X3WMK1_9BACI|nr:BMP family ABC transporter substrate-binding protein [Aquibacillus koreensis]MDC3420074.1 BMP family ABC transporter substrate-binding protein [Aquibacillus koreensis]